MPWIKLDDQWMNHPKILRAGRDARDMWLASITWCATYLTDGVFPAGLIPTLAAMAGIDVANCQTFARTLLDVCLWECQDGVYSVHDYLDYNPTKEQSLATSEARREAGKAGGVAKASKHPSKLPSKTVAKVCPVPVPHLTTITSKDVIPTPESESVKADPTPQQEMFGALVETCQLDGNLKSLKGKIGKVAAELTENHYTPAQVRAFSTWWLSDAWRAEKKPAPKLTDVLESIKQSLNPVKAGNNGKLHPSSPGYGLSTLPRGGVAREPTDEERAIMAKYRAEEAARAGRAPMSEVQGNAVSGL